MSKTCYVKNNKLLLLRIYILKEVKKKINKENNKKKNKQIKFKENCWKMGINKKRWWERGMTKMNCFIEKEDLRKKIFLYKELGIKN